MRTGKSLIDEYAPESLSDISGHPTAIKEVKKWAKKWEDGNNPQPLLLYGPPGTGKTSTAEAVSNDFGWPLVEKNASSERTSADLTNLAQQIRTQSIDGGHQLFLLDEIDSIDGRSVSPLVKVLDDPPNPIIFTANEDWKVPDSISNRCKKHEYKLQKRSIKPVLRNIAEEEGIDISSRQLGQLSTRTGLRDAINDLQSYAEGTDTDWDQRQTEDSPFAVTERILRNKDYIGGDGMTPPDTVNFLTENLPGEFEGVELMRAFQCLSKADQWNERVNRTQDYSDWKYSGQIAEQVADLRISEPYDGWMNINYPSSQFNIVPSPNSDTPEAHLYRELKETDNPNFKSSFNYSEFRQEVLPILNKMDEEEKFELILQESLSNEAYPALDITKTSYENWVSQEVEKDEEQETLNQFAEESDGNSEEDGEVTSLMDL